MPLPQRTPPRNVPRSGSVAGNTRAFNDAVSGLPACAAELCAENPHGPPASLVTAAISPAASGLETSPRTRMSVGVTALP